MTFRRVWADEIGAAEFTRDSRGNEIRPTQVEAPRWVETTLADATGHVTGSLGFALAKGTHRLALESVKEPMAIAAVILRAPEQLPTYQEYAENVAGQNTCAQQYIEIPAEHAAEKSDSSLYAITDRTSPMTDPQDPSKIRLNTIGGTKWQNVGQAITWRFKVTESGYYRIALRFKKDQLSGMFSSRSLRIDDRLLCEELAAVRFNYDASWQLMELGNEAGAFSFYLESGDHTITMEAVLGDMAEILGRTEDCLNWLNTIYRDILMITGSAPDRYRDYKFKTVIPDTLQEMRTVKERLMDISTELVAITGKKGEGTGLIDQMIFQLEQMLEKGSVMLASDVGCGAVCCRAAMECAAMNVYVNTRTLKNRVVAEALERKADGLLKEYGARAEAVAGQVTAQLRGR